jgi:AraC-like DNA-binding protein
MIYLYLYLKNANMRARRNSEEQGILKRIKAFADRCDAKNNIVLEPLPDEVSNTGLSSMGDYSPEFMKTMIAIIPTVLSKDIKSLSMRELSNVAGMRLADFYSLITSNVYKNPRPVALQMMLSRASKMLKVDRLKDIAKISEECGFITPNFFIASFYHKYHMTPEQYRQS